MANIVFLDNFDSFSYNLVEQFRALGHDVIVYRNTLDVSSIEQSIHQLEQPILVLSPGPGRPLEAGCLLELIHCLKGQLPIIGICLGHQAIVEAYGGAITHAGDIVHGKISLIEHNEHPIFNEISSPMPVARYHSLIASAVPECFTITSQVDGLVMSVVHEKHKICGLQFHPESIMTPQGAKLLSNIFTWALQ